MTAWEELDHITKRLKVPGGWLVRSWEYNAGMHQIFIADIDHTWRID